MKKIQLWNFVPYAKRMELISKHSIKSSYPREVANNKLVKDGIVEANLESVPYEVILEACNLPEEAKKEMKKKENPEMNKGIPEGTVSKTDENVVVIPVIEEDSLEGIEKEAYEAAKKEDAPKEEKKEETIKQVKKTNVSNAAKKNKKQTTKSTA